MYNPNKPAKYGINIKYLKERDDEELPELPYQPIGRNQILEHSATSTRKAPKRQTMTVNVDKIIAQLDFSDEENYDGDDLNLLTRGEDGFENV